MGSFAKWVPGFLLRLLALGGTIAATIVMATSHDSAAQLFGFTFEAKFTNSPTLM